MSLCVCLFSLSVYASCSICCLKNSICLLICLLQLDNTFQNYRVEFIFVFNRSVLSFCFDWSEPIDLNLSIRSVLKFVPWDEIFRFLTSRRYNGLNVWQIVFIFNKTGMELQGDIAGAGDCRFPGHGLSYANWTQHRNRTNGFPSKCRSHIVIILNFLCKKGWKTI